MNPDEDDGEKPPEPPSGREGGSGDYQRENAVLRRANELRSGRQRSPELPLDNEATSAVMDKMTKQLCGKRKWEDIVKRKQEQETEMAMMKQRGRMGEIVYMYLSMTAFLDWDSDMIKAMLQNLAMASFIQRNCQLVAERLRTELAKDKHLKYEVQYNPVKDREELVIVQHEGGPALPTPALTMAQFRLLNGLGVDAFRPNGPHFKMMVKMLFLSQSINWNFILQQADRSLLNLNLSWVMYIALEKDRAALAQFKAILLAMLGDESGTKTLSGDTLSDTILILIRSFINHTLAKVSHSYVMRRKKVKLMQGRTMSLNATIKICPKCKLAESFLLEVMFCAKTWTNYEMQRHLWTNWPILYAYLMELMLACKIDENGFAYLPLFRRKEACKCEDKFGVLGRIRMLKVPSARGALFPTGRLCGLIEKRDGDILDAQELPYGYPLVRARGSDTPKPVLPGDNLRPLFGATPFWTLQQILHEQKLSTSNKLSKADKLRERIESKDLDQNLSHGRIGHELVKYWLRLCDLNTPTEVLEFVGRQVIIYIDGVGFVLGLFGTRWTWPDSDTANLQNIEPDTRDGSFAHYLAFYADTGGGRSYRLPDPTERAPTLDEPCVVVFNVPSRERGTNSQVMSVAAMLASIARTTEYLSDVHAGRRTIQVHGNPNEIKRHDNVLSNLQKYLRLWSTLKGRKTGSSSLGRGSGFSAAAISNGHVTNEEDRTATTDLHQELQESMFALDVPETTAPTGAASGAAAAGEAPAAAASAAGGAALVAGPAAPTAVGGVPGFGVPPVRLQPRRELTSPAVYCPVTGKHLYVGESEVGVGLDMEED